MQPTLTIGNAVIYQGNNLDILPTLPDNSVDSIVCDPPYELGFMGKSWDSSGIAYSVKLWQECLRVLKPGGHLLAFSGSRTYHRMVVAIEDAGFEIRDMISWISNKTFPKSHNISKAIDKKLGVKREVVGINQNVVSLAKIEGGSDFGGFTQANPEITISATEEAKKWDGWGTGLKPTVEPIVLARKPIEETIAENVLTYGVGGLNIDATRIIYQNEADRKSAEWGSKGSADGWGLKAGVDVLPTNPDGRWPTNLVIDEATAEQIDEQSGISKPSKSKTGKVGGQKGLYENGHSPDYVATWPEDNGGGASRFFYVAKANKRDRNEGLQELPEIRHADRNSIDGVGGDNPRNRTNQAKQNFHPTVKPTALMQYLIRLVTPEGGVVLDPFAGSGSTGKATILEGKQFIGIEITAEYLPIIEGRLKHAYLTLDDKEDDLFE